MQLTGILLGVGAAAFQSVSYVFLRLYVADGKGHVRHILVAGHLGMGLASLLLLPLLWSSSMPPFGDFAFPLLGSSGFYLLGQVALFVTLRRLEASRAAPPLAIKVVCLGLLSVAFMGQSLSSIQWISILACVLGALTLGASGGRIGARAAGGLLTACFLYCFSDISITLLVQALAHLRPLHAAALGAAMSYTLCGIVALSVLPLSGGSAVFRHWRLSAGFGAAWFLGMVCLYACFGLVGPVFGNILQSTRGILSILLGACIARLGWLHIERRVTRRVLDQRLAASALMLLAIYLFQAHA